MKLAFFVVFLFVLFCFLMYVVAMSYLPKPIVSICLIQA